MMQGRQKQSKQELLGFPMMTTPEVLECLGALGINVHADDLQKPTPQSTQAIWAALLEALTGTPVEMFEGPKATLLGMMQYRVSYHSRFTG
jgi:kinetochore protein Nuf2